MIVDYPASDLKRGRLRVNSAKEDSLLRRLACLPGTHSLILLRRLPRPTVLRLSRPRLPSRLLITLLLLLSFSGTLHAHFNLNLNIRVFHIDHGENGLDVYLRIPMPYLVAHLLGEELADGSRKPAPFTTNAMIDGQMMHYVDYQALQENPLKLGQLAADGHTITQAGVELQGSVTHVRLYRGNDQPPFSTLAEAKRAFTENSQAIVDPPPFVGDTVVDVLLEYRPGHKVNDYLLSGSLDPGLEGQQETANLIVDYYGVDQQIYRISGLLAEPVEVTRSVWAAARTFVIEGVRHILAGYDHVLFVACLIIGALTLTSLAWRVTGFTVGHSITLSLGFFGYTPTADWFVPLIETGIALSIIYAAVLAISSTTNRTAGNADSGIVVTTLIGMLHGLGFSFVLQEILGVSSPNIWVSLLAFNAGVEIGQLAIIVLVWPLLYIIYKYWPARITLVKWCVAIPSIGIASVWAGQRLTLFLASV